MNPTFEEEILLLYNALNAQVFRFVLISHNHPSIYSDIRQALIIKFGKNRQIQEYSFKNQTSTDIRNAVLRLNSGILLLRDVEFLLRDENAELCTYFNQRRDFFAKHDIAFVFFIEPSSFSQIIKKLPDWWSIRSLELEFSVPLESSKLMQPEWNLGDSSSYTNWTAEEREAEIARIERLIDQADPKNLRLLGQLYASLGEAYFHSQQYDNALDNLQKSLHIAVQTNNDTLEGATLNNISQIYSNKGEYDIALKYLEKSLAISEQIGNRQGEGATLNNISQIYSAKGDYDTALRYLEQSLAIRQQIGDRQGESVTLNNISLIYSAKGDYDTTLQYLEKSLAITQQIGDRQGQGVTLNNLATTAHAKGDYDTALRYLEQSLAIRQQIGDINGMATTLNNMGAIFFEQEHYEEAVPFLIYAYHIRQKIGSPQANDTASYLGAIIERIGEARFQEILSKMQQ